MREFDLLVVGGGPGGLAAVREGVARGARVGLVERGRLGGDCLHTGCIPSKALLRTAKFLAQARASAALGLGPVTVEMEFAEVMARVKRIIGVRAELDSVERLQALGVACFAGSARLLSKREMVVGDRLLSARKIVLATGARPFVPPIEGLEGMAPLTSDSVWAMAALPRRLLVLGGGVIGCELAQAFCRLGSEVTLVERNPRLLPREDEEVSTALADRFRAEGMRLVFDAQARGFFLRDGKKVLRVEPSGEEIEFDEVLVALGRRPNTEELGLDAAGVALRENGTIVADAYLSTTAEGIYAVGDVAGPLQFAHFAERAGVCAVRNALGRRRERAALDVAVFPWAIYTDPEIARVGVDETEASRLGLRFAVARAEYAASPRARVEEEAEGFVKLVFDPGSGKVLGATVVGAAAGELIHEWALAMSTGAGLREIAGMVHAYPTLAEVNRVAARAGLAVGAGAGSGSGWRAWWGG